MISAIKNEEPLNFPYPISPDIKDIIILLLEKNPDRRPSSSDLLKNIHIQIWIEKMISFV
jgi:serine/threonine protein kinase